MNTTTEQTNNTETQGTEAFVEVAAETMTGDLIKALVDEIRQAPDVWPKLSEEKQQAVIDRIERRVSSNVREAVKIIAASGREVITADLEQITAKDGIKAVCILSKFDPKRHALLDSVGKAVLIVVADSQQFSGGEVPKPDPNQGDLISGAEVPEAA